MSIYKVGTLSQSGIHISDLLDASREAEVRPYDGNSDGILTMEEGTRYYRDKMGGARPPDLSDVLRLLGGEQHVIKAYSQEYYSGAWGAGDWKGDFQLDGIGFGNVRNGRQKSWLYVGNDHREIDTYHFLVDCDWISQAFIENNVKSATLEIGPRGFPREAGSDFDEKVAIPLDIATIDAYHSYNRGGGGGYVPERKSFAVSVDTEDLRKLMGDADGLSYYIRFDTNDGKTHWVNPEDGSRRSVPYKNFEITRDELRADRI